VILEISVPKFFLLKPSRSRPDQHRSRLVEVHVDPMAEHDGNTRSSGCWRDFVLALGRAIHQSARRSQRINDYGPWIPFSPALFPPPLPSQVPAPGSKPVGANHRPAGEKHISGLGHIVVTQSVRRPGFL
jgi:hypothetical protein